MDRNKTRFTIGELSEISDLSKKTLRYYDKIGLINPSERDLNTNYRYYSQQQVLQALIIKEMRLRGFNQAEIKTLFKYHDLNRLESSLERKINSIENEIEKLREQLEFTRTTHQLITKSLDAHTATGSRNTKKLSISTIPEMIVLFIRKRSRFIASELFWDRWAELQKMRDAEKVQSVGPFSAIFHDHYFNQFFFEEGDLEVFLPIKEGDISKPYVKKFGGFQVARMVFVGKYSDLLTCYVELVNQIEKSNYEICGPAIEEYLVEFSHCVTEDKYVTRVSFPIKLKDQ